VEEGDQKVGSAINAWGLLGRGLKRNERNRRASDDLQDYQRDRQTRKANYSSSIAPSARRLAFWASVRPWACAMFIRSYGLSTTSALKQS
jgi:hypothetical protein